MIYVGIDWSDASLEYHVRDVAGTALSSGKVRPDVEGLSELFLKIESHGAPDQISVAAETSHGAWVQALLDRGYKVYPVNPKTAERFREAMTAAGCKSDKLDAKMLAIFLATLEGQLRPLRPDAAEIIALRISCQDRTRLVEEHTAKLNELTAVLKAYYPAFMGLFGDIDSDIALAFLEQYPMQHQMQALGSKKFMSWLKRHSYPRMSRFEEMCGILEKPALKVSDHLQQAKSSLIRYLAKSLRSLNEEIAMRDKYINDQYNELPESGWVNSLPGVGKVLGPALLACIGRDQDRFASVESARALMGTAPVTKASGKSSIVQFRRACWKFARRTLQLFADQSRKQCRWAAAFYEKQRASGHGHNSALRALSHKWLKIIFAMQRTGQHYDEKIFIGSRQREDANNFLELRLT